MTSDKFQEALIAASLKQQYKTEEEIRAFSQGWLNCYKFILDNITLKGGQE